LLSIVTESVDAYKVCKERIDAVEKALEKALSDTGAVAKEAPRNARPAPLQEPDGEGDIPF
jgi:exodeoxyribonuclease VII small subunit